MKKPSFERWARHELSGACGGEFSFARLAAHCQSHDDLRLRALFVLYAIGAKRTSKLLELAWDECFVREIKHVIDVVSSRDIGMLALRGTPMRALPAHYANVLIEFSEAQSTSKAKADSKRALWEESRNLQLRLGITNSQIYYALDLNPGNANAYLKHGAVEKVSLQNAERIHRFLLEEKSSR